ncbi:tyrosine-type recombinase/integrase [Candidatus Mycoplasma pogonae]
MKFEQYLELFIQNYEVLVDKKARSFKTLLNVKSVCKWVKTLRIETTKINDLVDFLNEAIQNRNDNNNSKVLYHSIISLFLKFLAELTKQYFNAKLLIKPSRERNTRQAYSEHEMIFLEEKLEEFNNSKFTLIWKLFKHNGTRVSEFASIDWKSLKPNGYKIQIKSSKNGNWRYFKVPDYLRSEFDKHDLNLSQNTIQNHFTNFKKFIRSKYPDFNKPIHAHMLRHFFATKAMLNIGDISKVQALTGHVQTNTLVETYIKYNNSFQDIWWEQANSYTLESLELKQLKDIIENLKSQNAYLKNKLRENNIKFESND